MCGNSGNKFNRTLQAAVQSESVRQKVTRKTCFFYASYLDRYSKVTVFFEVNCDARENG